MDNPLTPTPVQSALIDAAWMGGIMDGEGSFNLHWKHIEARKKPKIHIQVRMGNTNQDILDEYRLILDKQGIKYSQYTQQAKKHHKIATIVSVCRLRDVLKYCKYLSPFLRGKRKHCGYVMNFVQSRLERTNGKYNIMYSDEETANIENLRKINMKGVRDCTSSE